MTDLRRAADYHLVIDEIQRGNLKTIQLTRNKVALVDDKDFEWLSRWKWQCNAGGYAYRGEKQKHVFMHREILNPPDNMICDHINGNTLDNRRSNLRICTRYENSLNLNMKKNNKSGFRGVYWNKKDRRWRASIQSREKIYLGNYETPEEAARVYNEAAKKYHGEFARLNEFPPEA